MVETILQSEFVTQLVLPFLLVFTLIFAILEKTKILGEDKRQINAIVAFVVGLIFVSFTSYVGLATNLLGVMALIAVILLVFMLLFGFASGEKEFKMPTGLKIGLGILIALTLIIALLVFTGQWDKIVSSVKGGDAIITNVVFLVVIAAAVAVVLWSGKKKD